MLAAHWPDAVSIGNVRFRAPIGWICVVGLSVRCALTDLYVSFVRKYISILERSTPASRVPYITNTSTDHRNATVAGQNGLRNACSQG